MSSLTMSSENGDVSVILKCLSIVIHWCLKMFMNCNSLVPEKNTLSIWTPRWYMWWRSMSTLSFQWTSPGYWQKHSDVWSSLIRVTDQSFSCKEQNHLDHIDVSESAVSFLLMLFRFPFDSNDCKFRLSPFTFHDYKVASSNIYNICNDHFDYLNCHWQSNKHTFP